MNRAKTQTTRTLPNLTEEQKEIVRRLSSERENERASAEQDLQKMGAEALPVICHLLTSSLVGAKWEERIFRALWAIGTTIPLLIALIQGKIPFPRTLIEFIFSFLFGMIGMCAIGFVITGLILMVGRLIWVFSLSRRAFRPAQEAALRVLAGIENVQAVGPLAEAARWFIQEYGLKGTSALRPALLCLLPNMNTADYLTLTAPQKNCLYALLREHSAFTWRQGTDSDPPMGQPRSEFDVPMTIALLQMYGRVGDSGAVSHIKRLVRGTYRWGESAGVHEAARVALAALSEHADEWQTATTHLRASSAPQASNDELLLPAKDASLSESQELLRADVQNPK
jgi:hypothetical protein